MTPTDRLPRRQRELRPAAIGIAPEPAQAEIGRSIKAEPPHTAVVKPCCQVPGAGVVHSHESGFGPASKLCKGCFEAGDRPVALKVIGLDGYGLRIVERVPIQIPPGDHNRMYLQTKREKLGHLLDAIDEVAQD